ncbi:Hypothetical protein KVN_LOCUS11 [uncultured virus]|nr:Hypothetical protein KVN_LOCUS11 [uncultured virus]
MENTEEIKKTKNTHGNILISSGLDTSNKNNQVIEFCKICFENSIFINEKGICNSCTNLIYNKICKKCLKFSNLEINNICTLCNSKYQIQIELDKLI